MNALARSNLVVIQKDVPGADAGAVARWLRTFAIWFGRYTTSIRNSMPRGEISDAAALNAAVRNIPWADIDRAAATSWQAEARPAMQAGAASSGLQLRWDLVNPVAQAWMREHGAQLVKGISAETRTAIRETVAEGLKGSTVRETARALRSVVGINERQAAALMRYRASLVEAGVAPDAVVRKADQYGARLHRDRAETIAQDQTMTALNEGKRSAWVAAKERGLIGASAKRKAIIGDACPKCTPFAGATAEVGGEFTGSDGSTSRGPPFHVRCGCSERLDTGGLR